MELTQYFSFLYVAFFVASLTPVQLLAQVPDSPRSLSGTRLAYYRWRAWLLDQPAIHQKVPPTHDTTEDRGGTRHADVHIRFAPLTILNVDEAQQTARLSAKIELWWMDEALSVDPKLALTFTDGNVSLMPFSVSVPRNSLWMPPVYVLEEIRALGGLQDVDSVQVERNGKVTIVVGSILTLSCLFEMHNYPFDEHDCTVTVVEKSLTFNIVPSKIPWDKRVAENYSVAGEWQLTNCTAHVIRIPHSNATHARFVIHIKRKTTFYIVVILLPMVVASFLYVLVFLIPPDVADKASYLVTLTVSLSVFNSFFVVSMPRGIDSASLPHIFLLLLYLDVQGFVTLLMTLFVLNKYTKEQPQQEAEVSDTSGLRYKGNGGRVAPTSDGENNRKKRKHVDKVSSKLDTVFFVVAFAVNTIVIASVLATMVH